MSIVMPFDLQTERLNAGLSVRGAAREIGVDQSIIRALEAGKRVNPANAKRVADYFKVKVVDLMPAIEKED